MDALEKANIRHNACTIDRRYNTLAIQQLYKTGVPSELLATVRRLG